MTFNPIGRALPRLAVHAAGIKGNRVGTAVTDASDSRSADTRAGANHASAAAFAKHANAAAFWIAKARHARETTSAKTLHAIGVSGASLSDNARFPRGSLPKHTGSKDSR
jgi:hypothetical protein